MQAALGTDLKSDGLCADTPKMKLILSIGVYVCLVVVLGLVLAWTAPREGLENDYVDDEN